MEEVIKSKARMRAAQARRSFGWKLRILEVMMRNSRPLIGKHVWEAERSEADQRRWGDQEVDGG